MKKSVVLSLLGLAAAGAAQAQQEVGRVISSTPVIQQVAVPRQVCNTQQVAVEQPTTGAGGVMGAIAGGALGSQIGSGSGRGVATVLGVLGGAVLGDRIESPGHSYQNVQQCSTQTYYENRAVSYNVVYEFAGKQYSVQLPHDPGPTVQLQITPMTSVPQQQQPSGPAYSAPVQPAPMVIAPAPVQTVSVIPNTVYAPVYYPRYYYPPVTLHLGYSRGWHHHGHGHRHRHHWR
ncbi:MAG: FIG01200701: possible membrane protein [uncultured Ramlibacter sp.]|uniref:FIG01200701: possible membrane protein n=1 Tax=uncultured Ramlibacter sp. TaxID=260755 RepID=A0A6J4PP05_9BURK|nr:MAG: FIG01200701: possible membrane protein [uncultured Ramlibacter sp.]